MWVVLIGLSFAAFCFYMAVRSIQKNKAAKEAAENSVTARLKAKADIKDTICTEINKNFLDLGWYCWTIDDHKLELQYEKIEDAYHNGKSMMLLDCDPVEGTAKVRGASGMSYKIDDEGCSCPAFSKSQLPCKHMYYVAMNYDD